MAPQVLQVEHHPYLTQERLVEFVKHWGIALTVSFFRTSGMSISGQGPTFPQTAFQSYLELGMGKCVESFLGWSLIKSIGDKEYV
jgi:hypothetical protein